MQTLPDTDWEKEKQRAHEDGYISCAECGHEISTDTHTPDGCLGLEHAGETCTCPLHLSPHDVAVIKRNYEWPLYVVDQRVYFCGNEKDAGTVTGFSDWDDGILVKWDGELLPIPERPEDLASQPG